MPDHAREAREYAVAFLEVERAKRALLQLAEDAENYAGEPDPERYEVAVERYQRACGVFCGAQDELNEAQSLDTRPLCTECLRRLEAEDLRHGRQCPATGFKRPHIVKEKP